MIFLMTLAFFAFLTYHTVNLMVHSQEWVTHPMNFHLPDHDELEYAGKILDRNGVVLAQSIDHRRVYHPEETVRKACVHVVGDNSVKIGTAVQTVRRSSLTHFDYSGNIVFGLGLPDVFKSGQEIVPRGTDIRLTIDSTLQTAALEALGDYKGAVVFYNYKTGEIVCMVSTPTYDPQNVPEDIETNPAYDGAYLNRAVSAAYPPGSTFKLVTAAAAISEAPGIENTEYECIGKDTVGEDTVSCFAVNGIPTAHGKITLKTALSQSCNLYFAKLALALGKDRMTYYAEKMGFNSSLEFDGISVKSSLYNVSDATENQLAWSGVGQYTVLETPINMAMISAAIANGGTPVMPYLIETIGGKQENTVTMAKPMMSKSAADLLYEMMDETVLYNYGKDTFCAELDVCAKTGTAEVGENIAHAWVTGFCKNEACPLAFAVIAEYGNNSFQAAVPVASKVLYCAAEQMKSGN